MISIDLSTIKKPTQGVGLGRARDMIKKLKWGGIPVYPQVFGVNSSSMVTYFLQRLDLVLSCLRHLPISTPPQRIAYLSSLTTSLFSHPQEVSVENFQILKNVKDRLFDLFEFVSQFVMPLLYSLFDYLSRVFLIFIIYFCQSL